MTAAAAVVPDRFVNLIAQVTAGIDGSLDNGLADRLSRDFPADGSWFAEVEALCHEGREDGWLCAREAAGIKFGRAVKPGDTTHGFSVDVVEMADIAGPHHVHPNGEIDMIMPIDSAALFDGVARGWKVYEPGSAHHPTLTGGAALVLYLLPQGAIDFTRA